jgi:hypothetical protein
MFSATQISFPSARIIESQILVAFDKSCGQVLPIFLLRIGTVASSMAVASPVPFPLLGDGHRLGTGGGHRLGS